MQRSFSATVGQVVLTSPHEVLTQVDAILADKADADLVVFPEFLTHSQGLDPDAAGSLADDEAARAAARTWIAHSPPHAALLHAADKAGKAIVFGCLHQDGEALTSRCIFYDPLEGAQHHYDKTHVHWTESFLRPGDEIAPFDTRFGRMGLLICFDTAFAEAAQVLGVKGAEIVCAVSAVPRHFDWRYVHRRLAGAAIANQYYVLAAHLGHCPDVPMGGHSAIFGPEGQMLAEVEHDASGAASAPIDHAALQAWREREKAAPHRRPEIYGALTEIPKPRPDRPAH